jgi:uncharacterized protein YndB with AHSA1/START domain
VGIVQTHVFRFATAACPESVWSALTCPTRTRRYFHGMALHSTWRCGDPVSCEPPGLPAVRGEVLWSEPGHRLTYTLEDPPSGTTTYLEWVLRPTLSGCVVRLDVTEPAGSDPEDEAEDVWLPVIERLQELLRSPEGSTTRQRL